MSSQAKARFTPEEYLTLKRKAECKSEYFAGEIFVMSGASRQHNLTLTEVYDKVELPSNGGQR